MTNKYNVVHQSVTRDHQTVTIRSIPANSKQGIRDALIALAQSLTVKPGDRIFIDSAPEPADEDE
jgi:hypothetical protein